jgi:hypothetical protein
MAQKKRKHVSSLEPVSGTGAHMRTTQRISTKLIIGASLAVLTLIAQSGGPNPTCRRCPATYIPVSELQAYTAKAVKYQLVDQQVRSVDVGKIQVGIGMGKLRCGRARTW